MRLLTGNRVLNFTLYKMQFPLTTAVDDHNPVAREILC